MTANKAMRAGVGYLAHGACVLLASAALLTWSTTQGATQVLEGGLLGAGAGAIIGGAIGGGRGAGRGAIIGGAAGALIGAAEQDRRRRYAAPPPRYYDGPPPRRGGYTPAYAATHDGLVYDVQTSLARLGYDPGPLDGVYGRRTGDAIAAYEHDHGLPVTGEPSAELLHHLIQRGG